MGTGRSVFEFCGSFSDLLGVDQHCSLAFYIAEVFILKLKRIDCFIDKLQCFKRGVEALEIASGRDCSFGEFVPSEDVGVAFPHIGKNIVDIVTEYGIGRDEEHLARIEAFTFLIEQVCDALQQDGRFAASRNTVY